jgi:hypothetical protein
MTDTERINWLENNHCVVAQNTTGKWQVVKNAQGGPFAGFSSKSSIDAVAIGDTLRQAIDNSINAVRLTQEQIEGR